MTAAAAYTHNALVRAVVATVAEIEGDPDLDTALRPTVWNVYRSLSRALGDPDPAEDQLSGLVTDRSLLASHAIHVALALGLIAWDGLSAPDHDDPADTPMPLLTVTPGGHAALARSKAAAPAADTEETSNDDTR